MSRELSIDDWLLHRPNAGAGGKFLSKWKKNTPPEVKVWLHCETGIQPLWRHNWPKLVELDKDGEKEEHIWSGDFNCWEEDKLLSQQYKRDRNTGERNHPPQICPLCIFLEQLRGKVEQEDIGWLDAVFVFDAEDDEEETILYAAPLYNGIPKELEDDERDELKEAGIRRTETWKQNTMAKCNYVFRVVDDANPSDGVQIAIEGTLLGEKMKEEIGKEIKRSGVKKGHPIHNPYPFLWENKKEERMIQKRFDATALTAEELREDVRKLVEETEAPSIAATCRVGDIAMLRSVMEEHIVEELADAFDWDQIFARAEKMAEKMADLGEEEEEEDEEEAPEESKPARSRKPKAKPKAKAKAKPKAKAKAKPKAKSKTRRRKPEPEPEPEPEDEGPKEYEGDDGIACEESKCGFMMSPDWEECPSCGASYEMEDVDEDEEDDEEDEDDGADDDDGADEPEPEPEPEPKPRAKKKKAKAKSKAKPRSKASARGKGRSRGARASNSGADPLDAFALPGEGGQKSLEGTFGEDDIPF